MTPRQRTARIRAVACVLAMAATTAIAAQEPVGTEPVVKGMPYSGEATTTVKMTMFDGNKIERSVTAKFYRDSAGRIRREQAVIGLETLDPGSDVRAVVTIVDPVEGAIYTLIPGSRTAHRLRIAALPKQPPAAREPRDFMDLGTKDIDGFKVRGRRTVITIPAGQLGNEKPIDIVDERWESAELKVLLQSRHTDPRSGVVEYKLTKITRGEPAPDLFKVPAGYTIMDTPAR
jgi:hypothetical protein